MKLTVVGSGYVGLTTGICLSDAWTRRTGRQLRLLFLDVVKEKIDSINAGRLPIFEQGLDSIFVGLKSKGFVEATSDYKGAIDGADIVIFTLPTPSRADGSIDLSYIEAATRSMATVLKETGTKPVLVYRSTMLPGTTDRMRMLLEREFGFVAGKDYWLCTNPEHLAEGTAVRNFTNPDKLVIGQHDAESGNRLLRFYEEAGLMPPPGKVFRMPLREAEMEKYFSNAYLATKVSFSNQMANICEEFAVNYDAVRDAACSDSRLGASFTIPGIGFGGSCFQKDVDAMVAYARARGIDVKLLGNVLEVNDKQPVSVAGLIDKLHGVKGKTVGILGVAFKGETDDIRSTRVAPLAAELKRLGAKVMLTDPYARTDEVMKVFGQQLQSEEQVIAAADLLVIGADHKRFKEMSYKKPVFDAKHSLRGARSIGGNVV